MARGNDRAGEALCRLAGITHNFGALRALDDVSLAMNPGEILAIVGENGAGKTTLMSVLFGLIQPDAGQIEWKGAVQSFRTARDAIARGLGMVHQHFMLYPSLSVLENIIIGAETCDVSGRVSYARSRADIEAITHKFGIALDLDAKVSSLPVQARQQIEIVKLLYRGADLIILDEPTAVLTPQESQSLFEMLKGLKAQGKSIVIITHKLDEVMALSDRVAIMRRGRLITEMATQTTSREEIAGSMVDGTIQSAPKANHVRDEVRLSVTDLTVNGPGAKPKLDGVTLEVRSGEILGIAGVSGSGQNELVAALVGMTRPDRGRITVSGEDVTETSLRARRDAGMAYLAEDRMSVGLAPAASVAENIIAGFEHQERFSWRSWLKTKAVRAHAKALISQFDIRTQHERETVSNLSGGNKQKIIVARELSADPDVIIAENPCWGVDVGAIAFIQKQLLAQAGRGAAVVLISSDLDELFELSDRIAVMYDGGISRIFDRAELDIFEVGAALSGKQSAEAEA